MVVMNDALYYSVHKKSLILSYPIIKAMYNNITIYVKIDFRCSTVPVAPANLSYAIVSNYTLMVSWNYPPSLIEQIISYEVLSRALI